MSTHVRRVGEWWDIAAPHDPMAFDTPKFKGSAPETYLRSLDPSDLPGFLTALALDWVSRCERGDTGIYDYRLLSDVATAVGRSPGVWSADALADLVDVVVGDGARPVSNYELPAHRLVIAAMGAAAPTGEQAAALAGVIERAGYAQGDTNKLLLRLRELAPHETAAGDGAALPGLPPLDEWAHAVNQSLGSPPAALGELTVVLARVGAKPSATWRAAVTDLLEADPSLGDAVHAMVVVVQDVVAAAEVGSDESASHVASPLQRFYSGPHAEMLRGAARAAPSVRWPGFVQDLARLALLMGTWPGGANSLARSEKLSNAAIAALAEIATPDALAELAGLRRRVTNGTVVGYLDRTLAGIATDRAVSTIELAEAAVPVVEEANATRSVLATERHRIEELLATEHTWEPIVWMERYRDHPLSRGFAARMVWQFDIDDTWVSGLPGERRDVAVALDGQRIDVTRARQVRLWHPHREPVEEVRSWRSAVIEAQIRQPIKQVFREIYLLTPAEVTTGDHSNRFASHLVRLPVMRALARDRRWSAKALGPWDGGGEAKATKAFGADLRVSFRYDLRDGLDLSDDPLAAVAVTGRVSFDRREGRAWTVLNVSDVPPVVLSEAMRDIDLFVSVASIGLDPTWGLRSNHFGEWSEHAFGDLTENAVGRRDALERLLPKLAVADRCEIDDRWLVVRGDRRTYRIHLGSGSVLMEPNNQYLCIVAAKGGPAVPVYLPFEDDGGLLALIISKAVLLAADGSISDPLIVAQIDGQPIAVV